MAQFLDEHAHHLGGVGDPGHPVPVEVDDRRAGRPLGGKGAERALHGGVVEQCHRGLVVAREPGLAQGFGPFQPFGGGLGLVTVEQGEQGVRIGGGQVVADGGLGLGDGNLGRFGHSLGGQGGQVAVDVVNVAGCCQVGVQLGHGNSVQ